MSPWPREFCTAHNGSGEPCGEDAVPGALVWRRHGGAAPQVAESARRLVLTEALYMAGLRFEKAHQDVRRGAR